MKVALVREIGVRERVNLEEVIKMVVGYARGKLMNEVQKLGRLIEGLENGEYEQLKEIYSPRIRKLSVVVERQKGCSIDKAKVSSVGRDEKSPLREDVIKAEKIRKQRQKLATRMVCGLYSTM
jgi:hypothetical protein